MDTGLKGKVVVVTGATSGIGKAIAEAFVREGARVAVVGRKQAKADEAAHAIAAAGAGSVTGFEADLLAPEEVLRLVGKIKDQWGPAQVLVNAAGGVTQFGSFLELDDDDWHKDMELNLMTAVRATRAFLPGMRTLGWGRIISISSESGIQPDADIPNYNAAKAALIAFSKSISKAFAKDGILINTVSPAFVMTPLVHRMIEERAQKRGLDFAGAVKDFLEHERPHIELHRPGAVHEVAAAVVFLASEAASFILGTNLRVDGGSVASIGG
jgi:NAD(P)-dependent dehydrogenase (short-subunit alcohol dehydrogenase family)